VIGFEQEEEGVCSQDERVALAHRLTQFLGKERLVFPSLVRVKHENTNQTQIKIETVSVI
jgi:hypothetical protein